MLSDPRIVRLFEALTTKDAPSLVSCFAPRRNGWVGYPLVEEMLGVDSDYAERLLDDLTRQGYLSREFHERIEFCPVCNSQELRLVTMCPSCQSTNLVRKVFLEHKTCGYVGPEDSFGRNGGGMVCPKCRNELLLIGSDYESKGIRFVCEGCGETTENPDEKWFCCTCQQSFDKDDLRELVLYRFVVNKDHVSKLKVERIPKARVREFLLREGYEVEEGVQTVGRSGAEHEIDLLATKRNGPVDHRIVVGFANAEEAVDSEDVIKLYAKAYDVNAQDIIMVASPRLSEDAQHFARHYHIRVFDSEQLGRADLNITN